MMSNNDEDELPRLSRHNLSELLHVFSLVGFSSVATAPLFAHIHSSASIPYIAGIFISSCLLCLLRFNNRGWAFTMQTCALLLILLYLDQDFNLVRPMLITGWIWLTLGPLVSPASVSPAALVCLRTKQTPATAADIGCVSSRLQMVVLQLLIVAFVNGYVMLCHWFLSRKTHGFHITGLVLIVTVWCLCFFCCICQVGRGAS